MKARGEKIVCVTAYDTPTAQMADAAGVDVVLVGDSVGNVVLGYESTLPVSLADMVHHTRAAARGVERALLVADMPFGSYQATVGGAVESAVELMKAGAQAVKLEGDYPEAVRAMVRAGIPVIGHVGMTPQSMHAFGGYKVKGKGDEGDGGLAAALSLDDAGVFSMVLELIPKGLAARITGAVGCPTIGIGAGVECDGQIQVFHDALGLSPIKLRHAKRYAEGYAVFVDALKRYGDEVRDSAFPGDEHSS